MHSSTQNCLMTTNIWCHHFFPLGLKIVKIGVSTKIWCGAWLPAQGPLLSPHQIFLPKNFPKEFFQMSHWPLTYPFRSGTTPPKNGCTHLLYMGPMPENNVTGIIYASRFPTKKALMKSTTAHNSSSLSFATG